MDLRRTTLISPPVMPTVVLLSGLCHATQWLATSERYHNQLAGEESGWMTGGKYRRVKWRR